MAGLLLSIPADTSLSPSFLLTLWLRWGGGHRWWRCPRCEYGVYTLIAATHTNIFVRVNDCSLLPSPSQSDCLHNPVWTLVLLVPASSGDILPVSVGVIVLPVRSCETVSYLLPVFPVAKCDMTVVTAKCDTTVITTNTWHPISHRTACWVFLV